MLNSTSKESFRSLFKTELYSNSKLIIKRSGIHRWGVFAAEPIKQFEILQESPYFKVSKEKLKEVRPCINYSYYLNSDQSVIGMGYAGLYNHSFNSNVDYELDRVNEVMVHYALKDIDVGEELTLNYGEENAEGFW